MGGVRAGRVITGWLVLVGLYTALTNSDKLAGAVGLGNSALRALSDPSRPLIRDHSSGSSSSSGSSGSTGSTGKQAPTSANPSGNPLFGQLNQLNPLSPDGANPLFGPLPLQH
jgi:hypothetical protein